ncbi:MAG: hypothetical protein CL816_08345 [Coxiellaceae bacterium]|nr:hypothetical protein [Coxiellaceae bacterium]
MTNISSVVISDDPHQEEDLTDRESSASPIKSLRSDSPLTDRSFTSSECAVQGDYFDKQVTFQNPAAEFFHSSPENFPKYKHGDNLKSILKKQDDANGLHQSCVLMPTIDQDSDVTLQIALKNARSKTPKECLSQDRRYRFNGYKLNRREFADQQSNAVRIRKNIDLKLCLDAKLSYLHNGGDTIDHLVTVGLISDKDRQTLVKNKNVKHFLSSPCFSNLFMSSGVTTLDAGLLLKLSSKSLDKLKTVLNTESCYHAIGSGLLNFNEIVHVLKHSPKALDGLLSLPGLALLSIWRISPYQADLSSIKFEAQLTSTVTGFDENKYQAFYTQALKNWIESVKATDRITHLPRSIQYSQSDDVVLPYSYSDSESEPVVKWPIGAVEPSHRQKRIILAREFRYRLQRDLNKKIFSDQLVGSGSVKPDQSNYSFLDLVSTCLYSSTSQQTLGHLEQDTLIMKNHLVDYFMTQMNFGANIQCEVHERLKQVIDQIEFFLVAWVAKKIQPNSFNDQKTQFQDGFKDQIESILVNDNDTALKRLYMKIPKQVLTKKAFNSKLFSSQVIRSLLSSAHDVQQDLEDVWDDCHCEENFSSENKKRWRLLVGLHNAVPALFSIDHLLSAGFTATELHEAGYPTIHGSFSQAKKTISDEVKASLAQYHFFAYCFNNGLTIERLRSFFVEKGITRDEFFDASRIVQLHKVGYSLQAMKEAGCSLTDFISANIPLLDLCTMCSFSLEDFFNQGVSQEGLKFLGFDSKAIARLSRSDSTETDSYLTNPLLFSKDILRSLEEQMLSCIQMYLATISDLKHSSIMSIDDMSFKTEYHKIYFLWCRIQELESLAIRKITYSTQIQVLNGLHVSCDDSDKINAAYFHAISNSLDDDTKHSIRIRQSFIDWAVYYIGKPEDVDKELETFLTQVKTPNDEEHDVLLTKIQVKIEELYWRNVYCIANTLLNRYELDSELKGTLSQAFTLKKSDYSKHQPRNPAYIINQQIERLVINDPRPWSPTVIICVSALFLFLPLCFISVSRLQSQEKEYEKKRTVVQQKRMKLFELKESFISTSESNKGLQKLSLMRDQAVRISLPLKPPQASSRGIIC